MIDTQVQKHPRASAVAGTKNSADRMATTVPAHNRIRERAYELYESCGRAFGQDQQDWLRAEQEILQR
jgi:hypothetical protein